MIIGRDWSSCLWQSLPFPSVSRRCIKDSTGISSGSAIVERQNNLSLHPGANDARTNKTPTG